MFQRIRTEAHRPRCTVGRLAVMSRSINTGHSTERFEKLSGKPSFPRQRPGRDSDWPSVYLVGVARLLVLTIRPLSEGVAGGGDSPESAAD